MTSQFVYAAPAYLHESLFHEILNQHRTEAIGQIAVVPFHSLIPSNHFSSSVLLEQTFQRIQNVADQCPRFSSMIHNPHFLNQLIEFRKEMAEYQIQLNDLPEDDSFQKELRILLESFYDLPVSSEAQLNFLRSRESFQHVHLMPEYLPSLFAQKVKNHMISLGAKEILPEPFCCYKTGHTALNRRQEIEACAQHIIENQLNPEDITIVLCDAANDIKLLSLVFDRYKIPYGMTSTSEVSKIAQLFINTVGFLRHKTVHHMLKWLHHAYSSIEHFDSLISYIDLFVDEIEQMKTPFHHVRSALHDDCVLDQREVDKLLALENHAESARQQIFFSFEDSILQDAYRFCCQHSILNHPDELKVLYQIKSILEDHAQVLGDQQYLDLICFEIESLRISKSTSFVNQVCVTDLSHPVLKRRHGFVLGCIQNNFPNFKGCSGIFDEDYVSFVKGYPTKAERQSFHAQQSEWIFHCAESIIFSSSLSDYEGKGRQMSVEIESRLDTKNTPWKIKSYYKKHNIQFKLNENLASSAFFRNNQLNGSISSFEKWFHCPASYFLSYGLKLRKQELPEFNIALMGTLQHAILEEIMNRYQKNISLCTEETLKELINFTFEPIVQLYFKKKDYLLSVKERCFKNMTIILEFLNDMEQNTDFVPELQEKHFSTALLESEPVSVQIHGIIDRIDTTHHMLRVLDYKSSHKSLSISKIQSGLQLQLLTYLYTASMMLNKTPAGCYYVSMKNDDISAETSKVDGRKFVVVDPEEHQEKELWIHSHRLDGMTFESTNMLDFDGLHIKNFKNGLPSKIYSIDDLHAFIQTIYQYLTQQLKLGNISLTPTEDACMFCDHYSICRFHSLKVKSILPEELTSHFFKEVKKS